MFSGLVLAFFLALSLGLAVNANKDGHEHRPSRPHEPHPEPHPPPHPRPSGRPRCPFACPSKDDGGYSLDPITEKGPYIHKEQLFCSFPSKSGENIDDFSCLYNKISGKLEADRDGGLCPLTASQDCTKHKRQNTNTLETIAERRAAATSTSLDENKKRREMMWTSLRAKRSATRAFTWEGDD